MTLGDLRMIALAMAAFVVPSIANAQNTAALTWIGGDFAGEHTQRAALMVAARVAGRTCMMQLDTGVSDSAVFSGAPPSLDNPVQVQVEFLGISASVPTSAEVMRRLHECQVGESVGTLGNAFFDSGSLTLDLKESKISYAPRPVLAGDAKAQPMFYARWTHNGGLPLVELRRNERLEGYVLLDTGSAASAFGSLSRTKWDAATGSAPLEATSSVHEFSVSSWGRALRCYSSKATVPMRVGSWPLGALPVTYCPDLDFAPPVKLEGLVGLRGFAKASITIDYVSGRWLVVESR